MIRVVLDTSVLVSAVISPAGPSAPVYDYERLKHLDRRRIAKLRGLLEAVSIRVKSRGRLRVSGHEEDNRIYECAVAAKARYIITDNTKHFTQSYMTTRIVNARQLLAIMELDGKLGH